MKKTLLLSALVASAAAFAGTTGSVEGFVNTSTTFKKGGVNSEEIAGSTLRYGSTFDVKVDNSGFSFGGTLHNKTAFNAFSDNLVDGYFNSRKSNLWVKYDFPEYKGIESYVKGKVDARPGRTFKGTLEVNAKKEMNGATVELNNKTIFPFQKAVIAEGEEIVVTDKTGLKGYEVVGKYDIENITKLTVKKDFDKIKELKAELEVKNTLRHSKINKGTVDDADAPTAISDKEASTMNKFNFNYVNANISGKYMGVKDLEVRGELNARYNKDRSYDIKDTVETLSLKDTFDLEDTIDAVSKIGRFGISAKVDAKYTGIKDTTLTGGAQLIYVNSIMPVLKGKLTAYNEVVKSNNLILPVLRAGVEYKGIENLSLSAKALVTKPFISANLKEGKTADDLKPLFSKDVIPTIVYLNANAKYDYKATNKLTISPEATVETYSFFVKDTNAHLVALTPKVSAEYKANDNLVFKGNVSTTSLFGIEKDHSGYIATNVKTGLSVKYTW